MTPMTVLLALGALLALIALGCYVNRKDTQPMSDADYIESERASLSGHLMGRHH